VEEPIAPFQYLLLMGSCLALTVPLEILGARVYRRPRRLLVALAAPIVVFSLWDAAAIARGHWWFDAAYVTGWQVPGRIPIEELTFFIAIPICTLLTFETVRRLLPRTHPRTEEPHA
jgi:lycopene cyclase domain-containing protein